MSNEAQVIVTLNGGSSSLKFAAFSVGEPLRKIVSGSIERIGLADSAVTLQRGDSPKQQKPIEAESQKTAADHVARILHDEVGSANMMGVGHRIVHGGLHIADHQLITAGLLRTLRDARPLDLAHLPGEIALIEAFQASFPAVPHVGCFDTVFHRAMPAVAKLLPIPRRFIDAGIRRFGFHGLSYSYLMQELERVAGEKTARGRIILAHLGSGASMAAVHEKQPVDTTMAFTPIAGLVMGTRSGDMDPGLLTYLMRTENLGPDKMDEFLNRQCGLLGVSGSSSDMRDLLARRSKDQAAAEAVDLFCYQASKFVGALAAALGGVDTLVFSGGIGEHAAEIRAGICGSLGFLGVRFDSTRNINTVPIISADHSPVTVRIIATDEEIMIARITRDLLAAPRDN